MNKTTLINWIFSSAGSGWIFGILSLIFAFIQRKNLLSNYIIVEEKRYIEPLSIHSNIKNKVKIHFDNNEVEELGQIFLKIYNKSNKVIENPFINIILPQNLKILDVNIDGARTSNIEVAENVSTIKFPFLNSYKEHQEMQTVSLIANGYIDEIEVHGSGKGWSVKHVPLFTEEKEKRIKTLILLTLNIVGFAIAILSDSFSVIIFLGFLAVLIYIKILIRTRE